MSNLIGTIQGRLLPKYKGNYQAHPAGYWQDEFKIAAELGLNCIEFILDLDDFESNPLLTDKGLNDIQLVSKNTGVIVKTICADYFMAAPLHSNDELVAIQSQEVITKLLYNASKLGVSDIVIPCVDNSSLSSRYKTDCFVERLKSIVKIAERLDINLSLETDLSPKPFVELLELMQSSKVKVNYDIGNSAALGYNSIEELDAYGEVISDIHIKDRLFKGGPVVLGLGSADFKVFFNKLKEFNYEGPFIMQAFRDEEGLKIFKKQLDWIQPFLKNI